MVRTSYFRVYRPLDEFSTAERRRLSAHEEDEVVPSPLARRWLISARLPGPDAVLDPHRAFVRKIEDRVYVCPWHTRLRMLTGLLAFRGSLPDEVADAFVPRAEANRAAEELGALEGHDPELRSYILQANWHVPLRWFAGFSGDQRILTENRNGLRVRYESGIVEARARLERTMEILESAWIDDEIVAAVRDLGGWLAGFSDECLVELDYGSVAGMFSDEDLVEDRSAAQVWDCLTALAAGDVAEAGRLFALMTDRWSEVRAYELAN